MFKKLLLVILILSFTKLCSAQSYQWRAINPGLYSNDSTTSQTSSVKFLLVDTSRDLLWLFGAFQGGDTIESPDIIGYDGKNFVDANTSDTSIGTYLGINAVSMYNGKVARCTQFGVSIYDVDSQASTVIGLFPSSSQEGGLCLSEYNGDLIVAGQFGAIKKPGGSWVNTVSVARWDGINWHPLDSAGWGLWGFTNFVNAMEVYNGKLYVGGNFQKAGAISAWGIASWDGSNWACLCDSNTGKFGIAHEPPSQNWNATIQDMNVFNNKLYIIGEFDSVCAIKTKLASWDGLNWIGSNYPYYANLLISSFGSHLVVYNHQGGASPYLFYCEGTQFPSVDSGLGLCINKLVGFHDTLYAGGCFSLSGNTHLFRFARLLYDSSGVGINELSDEWGNIIVYPNPATEQLTIAHGQLTIVNEIQITDVLGRIVLQIKNEKTKDKSVIDVHSLVSGVYFVRVIDSKGETKVVRFVKQ